MKKLGFLLFASFALVAGASAQGGGFTRRTPEERAASIHQKLDSAFKLEPAKLATLDTALIVLYKAQDKKREEFMASGDREAMQAEMQKFNESRDAMMKAVLTADQFVIWKEKIEPSMRPQRPGGPR